MKSALIQYNCFWLTIVFLFAQNMGAFMIAMVGIDRMCALRLPIMFVFGFFFVFKTHVGIATVQVQVMANTSPTAVGLACFDNLLHSRCIVHKRVTEC
jgi:hypothetical protein